MIVLHTKNYELFQTVPGNRSVSMVHVKRLADSIRLNNMLDESPIKVNKKMQVIDGQHRLEACKILEVSVPYLVLDMEERESLATVIELQKQKPWGMTDYINSQIALGNENYVILSNFLKEFKLPLDITVTLLRGGASFAANNKSQQMVKDGTFEVRNSIEAEVKAALLRRALDVTPKHVSGDKMFITALLFAMRNPSVNFSKLTDKLAFFAEKDSLTSVTTEKEIVRSGSTENYLQMLNKIYNWKAKTGKVSFLKN